MSKLRLVHWNAREAEARVKTLAAAGHDVVFEPLEGTIGLRKLREAPPDAFVIDLSRLPSNGREVGLYLRKTRATRHVPLVFADGDPAKVARIRELLPDAVFTTWGRIRSSVKRAVAHPPAEPAVPASTMAGYSKTPLARKLGIRDGSTVELHGAPRGFEKTLGALPGGARVRRRAGRDAADLAIWFVKSARQLDARIGTIASRVGKGGVWIAWPKQSSGVAGDLTQARVRAAGLAAGLVDYKIAAIDPTWSGLRFARRASGRSRAGSTS